MRLLLGAALFLALPLSADDFDLDVVKDVCAYNADVKDRGPSGSKDPGMKPTDYCRDLDLKAFPGEEKESFDAKSPWDFTDIGAKNKFAKQRKGRVKKLVEDLQAVEDGARDRIARIAKAFEAAGKKADEPIAKDSIKAWLPRLGYEGEAGKPILKKAEDYEKWLSDEVGKLKGEEEKAKTEDERREIRGRKQAFKDKLGGLGGLKVGGSFGNAADGAIQRADGTVNPSGVGVVTGGEARKEPPSGAYEKPSPNTIRNGKVDDYKAQAKEDKPAKKKSGGWWKKGLAIGGIAAIGLLAGGGVNISLDSQKPKKEEQEPEGADPEKGPDAPSGEKGKDPG